MTVVNLVINWFPGHKKKYPRLSKFHKEGSTWSHIFQILVCDSRPGVHCSIFLCSKHTIVQIQSDLRMQSGLQGPLNLVFDKCNITSNKLKPLRIYS